MSAKIGRNQPCPCGSGRKFKRCCGGISPPSPKPADVRQFLNRLEAAERIRQNQQGLGRPVMGAKLGSRQFVAVRDRIYSSANWKTFPDFLGDYAKRVLGESWGNAEIAKPYGERHPLMQLYDTFCRYQQAMIQKPGEVHAAPITGVVACYLGMAYGLYLLDHNAELQDRLVRRLKDPGNFQGAYYELMIASILIRAGFELVLEDETDGRSKHCEFSATSKHTGKRYWVEAKMRGVVGLLGKTDADGTRDQNPMSHLIPHLNAALTKPAADARLIFLDLNAEPDRSESGKPAWAERVVRRLEQYEQRELPVGCQAYLFVTNMAYHRRLNEVSEAAALPFGLGIPDFNRPGYMRLSEAHRRKQQHIDAFHIGDAFQRNLQFPSTFDGKMPSEVFRHSERPLIGQTVQFEDDGGNKVVGAVTAATVNEVESAAILGVLETNGRSSLVKWPMSAEEVADYKAHPDDYFGEHRLAGRKITDKFELFEWLIATHRGLSRETLLHRLSGMPNFEAIKSASDEELLAFYCEAMAGRFP